MVIGCGRDYGDVAPVRGAFTGSGTAQADAEVVIGRQPATLNFGQPTVPSRARSVASALAPSQRHLGGHHQQQQQQQQ